MGPYITEGAFYEVFVVVRGLVEEAGSGELRWREVLMGPVGVRVYTGGYCIEVGG
jgi:hypothetical protein